MEGGEAAGCVRTGTVGSKGLIKKIDLLSKHWVASEKEIDLVSFSESFFGTREASIKF